MKQLFLSSSGDKVLRDITTKLSKKPNEYNVAFINTAAEAKPGDHPWVRAEKDKLIEIGFNVNEFSITKMKKEEIENRLENKQIIYFTGGSVFHLMNQLFETGCNEIIKNKIEEVIFIGSSAGSKIFGDRIDLCAKVDEGIKDSEITKNGLKIIDMTILPHWGSEHFKERFKNGFDQIYTEGLKIVPITNQQYIWVKDDLIQTIQV